MNQSKLILAFVGMPGAGKTEAASYMQSKGIPFVRFGSLAEEEIRAKGLPLTTENERIIREELRKKFGMAAFAVKAEPKINILFKEKNIIGIDGLYSWEEYIFLKSKFEELILIHVYSEPKVRYKRLSERPIRPVALKDSRSRDIAELEKLNKGGPIAIADYLIENNKGIEEFHKQIDALLDRLKISI